MFTLPHWTHTSPLENYYIPWYLNLSVSLIEVALTLFGFGYFIKNATKNNETLQPGAKPRTRTSSPMALLFANYLIVSTMNAYVFHLILKERTNITWEVSFTPAFIANVISKTFVMTLLDDFGYYWYHKACHKIPWMYHHIHYIHHEDNAPTDPLTSPYYDHPFDFFMGSLISFVSIFVIPDTWIGCVIIFLAFKSTSAVMEHCGKSIRFAIGDFVVFDNKFHDNHHKYSLCNYAQNFPIFDVLFNTARLK